MSSWASAFITLSRAKFQVSFLSFLFYSVVWHIIQYSFRIPTHALGHTRNSFISFRPGYVFKQSSASMVSTTMLSWNITPCRFVPTYESARHHNPEEQRRHPYRCENLEHKNSYQLWRTFSCLVAFVRTDRRWLQMKVTEAFLALLYLTINTGIQAYNHNFSQNQTCLSLRYCYICV
jgi:hypothetical protein